MTASVLARARKDDAGFTLVELMVVIALLMVIGGIVTSGLISAFQVTRHAENRIQAVTALQNTLANAGREIRAADSRDVSGAALIAGTPTSLQLDVRRGGKRIRFTYTLAGGQLTEERRVWANLTVDPASVAPASVSTRTLVTDVVNTGTQAAFAFRGGDGGCITGCMVGTTYTSAALTTVTRSQVHEVQITIHRSVGAGRPPIEATTRISLRNA